MQNSLTCSLVILSTLFIAGAFGLRCYECIHTEGKPCSDLNNAEAIDCENGATLCAKFVIDGEVTRSCYSNNREEGCRSTQSGPSNSTTVDCFCSGELCNSAMTSHPTIISGIHAIILTLATPAVFHWLY